MLQPCTGKPTPNAVLFANGAGRICKIMLLVMWAPVHLGQKWRLAARRYWQASWQAGVREEEPSDGRDGATETTNGTGPVDSYHDLQSMCTKSMVFAESTDLSGNQIRSVPRTGTSKHNIDA